MTPREALIQQYQVRFQQLGREERLSEKPLACTQDCGGRLPDPPARLPQAQMQFECGLGAFGVCPVRKSINRSRRKARRRNLGLWRRSVRVYWRRLEAQAITLEHPGYYPGLEETIARYPDSARIDEEIFGELRKDLDIAETLDVYLMLPRRLR